LRVVGGIFGGIAYICLPGFALTVAYMGLEGGWGYFFGAM